MIRSGLEILSTFLKFNLSDCRAMNASRSSW